MGWVNLGDMRTRVRDFLKERDEDGYWTNEEINRHINEGVTVFARDSRSVEGSFSQDVEPGRQAYNLPGMVLQGGITYVQFQEPGKDPFRLEYLDPERFHWEYPVYTTGVPNVYSIRDGCLYLGPTPKRYDEAPVKMVVEGSYVSILLTPSDRIQLLAASTSQLGLEVVKIEVVTAASLGLTGANKVILNLPEDEDWVLCDTTSTVGLVTIVLDNYILKAKLPDGNYANLYATDIQSQHGTLLIHGYEFAEKLVDDTDGCEIHDEYIMAPVHYAVSMCFAADDKRAQAADFLALFQDAVNKANWANRMRQSDQLVGTRTSREELGRAPRHRRAF